MHVNDTASRVLVVMPAWIGDAVMAEPLIRQLRQLHPHAAIDALASPWIAAICQRMGHFAQIITNPFAHGQLKICQRYRFAKNLITNTTRLYSHAYVLPNSWKSALIPFFAKIPQRIGYHGESRYFLLNQRRKSAQKKKLLLVASYYYLAEEKLPSAELIPKLRSDAQQIQLLSNKYSLESKKIIAICPGAEFGLAKRWPAEYYAQVISNLSGSNQQFLLMGSSKDHQVGEQIISLVQTQENVLIINLCGQTTLTEAIDLLAQADLVICNDSGLMHISAALDRAIIAIFGSSSAQYTPPLVANKCQQPVLMQSNLSCAPCFMRTCRFGHYDCLKQTSVASVSSQALQILMKRAKD